MKIYLSASNQPQNIGVDNYTNEEKRMHELKVLIKEKLKPYKEIIVYTNEIGWTLKKSVANSNSINPDIHITLHSNANSNSSSDGTEVFFNHNKPIGLGNKLAKCINKYLAFVSPGTDKGVLPDTYYYNGMYEVQNTIAIAVLIECFYHSNKVEVDHFLKNMGLYAEAIVKGILEYFNINEKANVPQKEIKKNYLEILKEIKIDYPETWKNGIEVAVKAASDKSDLGVLEVFKFLPELIEKLYYRKGI